MKAIELFAGIGGFKIALDELHIQTIWANDIKETAAKVYVDCFGDEHFCFGDINQNLDKVPNHDILTGGFPCQPFSSAGKKNGIRDPRGTLFSTIAQILDLRRPKYFVLENVKRLLTMEAGWHFGTIIHTLSKIGYTVEWRLANAYWFGLAQNRPRMVICGIRDGDPDISHLLSSEEMEKLTKYGIDYRWKDASFEHAFQTWGICHNGSYITADTDECIIKVPKIKLEDILEANPSSEFDMTESTLERLGGNTTVDKMIGGVHVLSNQNGGQRMGYTIFGTKGLSPTLTASTSRHYERYKVNGCFRRLTNIEYARLQGFPDTHCKSVSIYNQYELYGNAIPPKLARWAIESITSKNGIKLKANLQTSLF